jgi:SAM-dependent methyltransferase
VIRDNSDVAWVQLGNEDPYFGVLSDERFRLENLNDEHKREFFETGQVHVKRVLRIVLDRCGAIACQKSALDFGCGVGRLVIPFASVFEHVTCVDVSPAMLRVAEENCLQRGIRNVDFLVSDDDLTRVVGKFDFIHCYLVLQHIPTRRGERIIDHLLERLNNEGVLALHFPFKRNDSPIRKSAHFLRRNFWPLHVLLNIFRRKPWNSPLVQMNVYDANRILVLLAEHGIKDVFSEVVDCGGLVSAFIFAKKPVHPIGRIQRVHLWEAELDG